MMIIADIIFAHTPEIQINALYNKNLHKKYYKYIDNKTLIFSPQLCVFVVVVTVVGCSAVECRTRN